MIAPRPLLRALVVVASVATSGAAGAQPALSPPTTPPDRYQVAGIHAYPWMQGRGTVGAADELTARDRVPIVAEVGCEAVTRSAKLTVPGTRAAATRTVRFGCGE